MNTKTARTCIALLTFCEGTLTGVECFGDNLDYAVGCARARTEDGDGTYSYRIKRTHGARAEQAYTLNYKGDKGALLAMFA